MDVLLQGIGYLQITFIDGSMRIIRTTLNKDILSKYGVSAKEHHIFCIDTGNFIPIRDDAVDISVHAEFPILESEVNKFASRFI